MEDVADILKKLSWISQVLEFVSLAPVSDYLSLSSVF